MLENHMFNESEVSVPESFETLQLAVEKAGFLTSLHADWMDTGRLVCASRRDEWGMTGISFWVALRNRLWYLGMWGGKVFRFNDPTTVIKACIRFLDDESLLGYCLRVPAGQQAEYSLVVLSEEEIESVFPEGDAA
jgi:hypothetical protein